MQADRSRQSCAAHQKNNFSIFSCRTRRRTGGKLILAQRWRKRATVFPHLGSLRFDESFVGSAQTGQQSGGENIPAAACPEYCNFYFRQWSGQGEVDPSSSLEFAPAPELLNQKFDFSFFSAACIQPKLQEIFLFVLGFQYGEFYNGGFQYE